MGAEEQDGQLMNYLVRMVVPLRREFGRNLNVGQFLHDFSYAREVLDEAVAARRNVPIAQQKAAKVAAMRVHGRTGEPCPVGDGVIEDIPGTHGGGQWCPSCQASPA